MAPDVDLHPISQPMLVTLTGVSNVTFNSWRKRNGLFPRTNTDRGWNRYTLAEAQAANVVVDLTKMGLAAQKAVDIGMKLLPTFELTSYERVKGDPTLEASREFLAKRMVAVRHLNLSEFELEYFTGDNSSQLLVDNKLEATPVIVIDLVRSALDFMHRFASFMPTAMRNPELYLFDNGSKKAKPSSEQEKS